MIWFENMMFEDQLKPYRMIIVILGLDSMGYSYMQTQFDIDSAQLPWELIHLLNLELKVEKFHKLLFENYG